MPTTFNAAGEFVSHDEHDVAPDEVKHYLSFTNGQNDLDEPKPPRDSRPTSGFPCDHHYKGKAISSHERPEHGR